ncbi:cytochrome P450 [Hypoxylon sp. FL1284]|nr:cytochrome P450 [Hypoxylon sp. FL1284]
MSFKDLVTDPHLSLGEWLAVCCASTFVLYSVWRAVYNLYFHPLAKFPGPLLARASLIWRIYHSVGGHFHFAIEKQHRKYGHVFRVSPNELSFSSVQSWTDIYNPPPSRHATCVKADFYDIYASGFAVRCVGSERDPARHGEMKKTISPGFSAKALSQHEGVVHACVDRFVEETGKRGAVNLTDWYEMVAFDILGEMAFGESFHSLEQGKPHFWSQLVEKHVFYITLLDNLRRYPLLRRLGQIMLPSLTVGVRNRHVGYSRRLVQKRLETGGARNDLLTSIVSHMEKGEVSREQLTAHASTLVIAGGETVATFLSAVTYHLVNNPSTLQKLATAIRDEFATYDSITSRQAQQIPYLQAVISEGLRIYPPGSQGFPRISPGATIDGHWVPKGAEVYTSAWTVTHDPDNFERPNAFVPERWLAAETRDNRAASQPFSLGPRSCMGRNLAYVEMSVILAKLLWRYDLSAVDKALDWNRESHMHVMWSKPELWVQFEDRGKV